MKTNTPSRLRLAIRSFILSRRCLSPLRLIAVSAVLLVGLSQAHARTLQGNIEYPALGVKFVIPDGWIGQETDNGIVLGSHTEAGLILLTQHQYESLGQIRDAADQGIVDAALSLRRDGNFYDQMSNAVGAPFSGLYDGQPARAWAIALLNPHGAGVSIMALTTQAAWTEALAERARAIAASVEFSRPDISPQIAEWKAFLSDVRLTYMSSSYSSGPSYDGYMTGGGHSTERLLHLCAAGHYRFNSSSSMSIDTGGAFASNSGSDQGAGRWDVIADAHGAPLLQLSSHDGNVRSIRLSYEDGKTYLDGTRYFRTLPGDTNGYAPNCP